MRRAVLIAVAAMLCGCGGPDGMLAQAPVERITLRGNYQQAAECVYGRLRADAIAGAQKADLPGSGRTTIALDTGQVRYWEMTFSQARPGQTLVEITSARTLWGPFPADRAVAMVRSCDAARL